jgi:hypothetical protein
MASRENFLHSLANPLTGKIAKDVKTRKEGVDENEASLQRNLTTTDKTSTRNENPHFKENKHKLP